MKAGQMNETEKAYAAYLESERIAGRIKAYWFESIKLKIAADTCWYNPDFLVLTAEDRLELHEVKGSPKFFADDAKVKTKVKVKKKPVKAGSTPRPHGGFPTKKVIKITAKLKARG